MLNPERGDYETLVVSRNVLSGSTKLMAKGRGRLARDKA